MYLFDAFSLSAGDDGVVVGVVVVAEDDDDNAEEVMMLRPFSVVDAIVRRFCDVRSTVITHHQQKNRIPKK